MDKKPTTISVILTVFDEQVKEAVTALVDKIIFPYLPADNKVVIGPITLNNVDVLCNWTVEYSKEMNADGEPQFATIQLHYTKLEHNDAEHY